LPPRRWWREHQNGGAARDGATSTVTDACDRGKGARGDGSCAATSVRRWERRSRRRSTSMELIIFIAPVIMGLGLWLILRQKPDEDDDNASSSG